jgi:hypothetical protein
MPDPALNRQAATPPPYGCGGLASYQNASYAEGHRQTGKFGVINGLRAKTKTSLPVCHLQTASSDFLGGWQTRFAHSGGHPMKYKSNDFEKQNRMAARLILAASPREVRCRHGDLGDAVHGDAAP